MSSKEVFVQQFAALSVHYLHALALEPDGENGAEQRELNDMPIVELDRKVSAARIALLEIEPNARENDDGRQYYSNKGTECSSTMPAPVDAQNALASNSSVLVSMTNPHLRKVLNTTLTARGDCRRRGGMW